MARNNRRGDFWGIAIPKSILADKNISITEKFIYGYIASFRQCCTESNAAIADKIGVSESTIKHCVPNLARDGYISISRTGNNAVRRLSILRKTTSRGKGCGKLCGKSCEKVVEK